MSTDSTITVEDLGPLAHLSISIKPGVTILTGRNDSGKSVTLEAVSRLVGGNGNVTCRDGAARGSIEGFGVKITAGRSTRRTGELEALSLESSLPVSALVDPKIKDPAAADAHRIKALVQLTGATADPALFYELVGGKEAFDRLCPPDTLKTDDLVDMAGRIKRAIEAQARREEDAAKVDEGKALADRGAGDGLDLSAETDGKTLQQALEDAAGRKSQVDEQARAARLAKAEAEKARAQLAKATGQTAVTMEAAQQLWRDASEKRNAAQTHVNEMKAKIAKIEAELRNARSELGSAVVALDAASDAVSAAQTGIESVESNQRAYAGWQAAIDAAAGVAEPEQSAIDQAAQAVQQARQAIEQAAVVRAAKERIARAKAHQDEAAGHRKAADKLREAAQGTDDVLSQAVASDYLMVKGGRLVTVKADGKEVLYAERSMGTRWKIALTEAVTRIRRLGVEQAAIIAVPQDCFESLDAHNRRIIHEHAVELGVCILTAEAIGDEVRAVAFDPDRDWKANATEALAAQ